MTLLASAVAIAAENITVNAPNGNPFLTVKVFAPGETSSEWGGEGETAERELTDREVGLIASGLGYWGTVFQDALKNTAPAVVGAQGKHRRHQNHRAQHKRRNQQRQIAYLMP